MATSRFAGIGLVVALALGLLTLGHRPAGDHGGETQGPRFDAYGDPLPDGAVARLGTLRWRHQALKFAFSPDGNYFATCWNTPRVHDARSGQFLRTIDTVADEVYFSAAGNELITIQRASKAQQARVWDAATGRKLREFPVDGRPVSWSGKFLATETYSDRFEQGISIWDLESGKKLSKLSLPERGFFSAALASDGKTLALRFWEKKRLYLLDRASGKALHSFPLSMQGDALFAPDSKSFFFTDDGQVFVADVFTGRIVRQLEIPKNRIAMLAVSPDGRYLAVTGAGLRLWDLGTSKLLHVIENTGMHGLSLLTFSGDGKTVVGQETLSHLVRRWDVATGKEMTLEDPEDSVQRLAFGPDGNTVVAMYKGRMTSPSTARRDLIIWRLATTKPAQRFQDYDPKRISHFIAADNRISPNGFSGVFGDAYPTCSPDGRSIPVVVVGREKPERSRLLPGGKDGPIRDRIFGMMIGLWDVHGGKLSRSFAVDVEVSSEFLRIGKDEVMGRLVLSPDRKLLAGWGNYNSIFVWDLTTGAEVSRWTFPAFPGPVCNAIAFSEDGKKVISSHFQWRTKKNTFHFHDLATGQELAKVDCAIAIDHVRCGPVFAGDRLAALAVADTVYLVDPLTGVTLGQFKGHLEPITCLAFSPDGRRLATGSYDTTILVWDVSRLRIGRRLHATPLV